MTVAAAAAKYDASDFASEPARDALASRLAPHGIRLDAFELGLLIERLGRVPRWAELVIMNTMWSEHCSYKSTRHLLTRLPTVAPQVVLGPGEDAGAVRLGEYGGRSWLAVLAHESHNHPSQIVPYEGAATGVGGIVRDVYCMGADVVGVLDALRVGTGRRGGGLRARAILDGVVGGIADYGNALGVANLGGDLDFHDGYDANVLVNVVAVGIVDEAGLVRSRVPCAGDFAFVLAGKPTDASGFGGAAFSSGVLDAGEDQRGAVQLPDPFLKRVLVVANQAVLARARAAGWAIGFKDLGAGGIACVTSELADAGGVGAEVWLDRVHRVQDPLLPEVVLCAETQERFCWVVPWEAREEVVAIYNQRFALGEIYPGAGASVVGRTRDDGRYRALWGEDVAVDCAVSFLTSGVRRERASGQAPRAVTIVQAPPAASATGRPARAASRASRASRSLGVADELAAALGSTALCSRAPLFQRYDPEVKGLTVVRAGDADAGVLAPVPGAPFGFALAVDGNPRLCALEPALGAARAVAEAARNVAAVGAYPWALTDCLNFGRPSDPSVMAALEASIDGLAEAACALGTLPMLGDEEVVATWAARVRGDLPALPFVSGNVSLYNENQTGAAIPPSPIVACLGLLPDVARATTPGFEQAGNALVLVGPRRGALGASRYAERHGINGAPVAAFDGAAERADLALVVLAHARGWLAACHDVSDGGLAQTLVEMAFAAGDVRAFAIDVTPWLTPKMAEAGDGTMAALFSEEPGFVLEVPAERVDELFAAAQALGARAGELGRVLDGSDASFAGPDGVDIVPLGGALAARWRDSLHDAFDVGEEALS